MNTIKIGTKFYNGDNLTEQATILLADIHKIDSEMGRLSLQTSIATLAKNTLIEKLVNETVHLEEIDEPPVIESQTQAATEAPAPLEEEDK